MRMRSAGIALLALTGCSTVDVFYAMPSPGVPPGPDAKIVDRPRDSVWDSTVPLIGKQSLVISGMDRSTGVVAIRATGDLSGYVDCGHATSHVETAAGARTDYFAYSKPHQIFYSRDPGGDAVYVDQSMSVGANTNLVFEQIAPDRTRVSANTHYVVRRDQTVQGPSGPVTTSDTISFQSGGGAVFPTSEDGFTPRCVATGRLERQLLELVR